MHKQAVIIFGPPGSGKGTQAELLARKYGFIHFDTGRAIESAVRAPGWEKSPILRRERHFFDTGKLCTPSWVEGIIRKEAEKISKVGLSLVFSGSPRTFEEAVGKNGKNGFFEYLGKLFGKENVKTIFLKASEESSLKRNSHRLVCSVCGQPLLSGTKLKNCAFCFGKMRARSLDKPEVIKVRLKEYHDRTEPVLKWAKAHKFKVTEVNAESLPYKVFESVKKSLKLI